MRRHAPLIGFVALALLAAAGCGRQKSNVIARVNNQPVTEQQLLQALERAEDIAPRYREAQKMLVSQLVREEMARLGVTMSPEDQMNMMRRLDYYFSGFPAAGQSFSLGQKALDTVIVEELVRQEARSRGIEVTKEELQSRISALRDYQLAYTGQDFDSWLEETGQTEDDIARSISLRMLTAKLVLGEEDSKRFFEENKDQLAALPHNNESVIFRQIIVASKEEAEAIHRELTAADAPDGPADFAEIAEARSIDPVTRARGGMAGWMAKGKSDDPELEKVLFSLKEGEISQPVVMKLPEPETAEAGEEAEETAEPREFWRLLKVEKYVPPHEITLEDNADVIEDWLLSQPQMQMQLQEFWNELRAKASVEIVAPRYRPLADSYERQREARERRREAETPPLTAVPQAPAAESPQAQEGNTAQPADK